jgi:hypothetical protein
MTDLPFGLTPDADQADGDPAICPHLDDGLCAEFGRTLSDWSAYETAATGPEPHWFKDMLSHWRPSGQECGPFGLRLAIRNGYLNVYRWGQSVAKVQAVRGELQASIHYKYILGERDGYDGPLYLTLKGDQLFSGRDAVLCYSGPVLPRRWIKAAESYAGREKKLVDQLVACNGNVIDLEMGLPAWIHNNSAIRMDLVAIEHGSVVFWEAKTVDDARIRCRGEAPEVLEQLASYAEFLRQDAHVWRIQTAYRQTAGLLVRLSQLAESLGNPIELSAAIIGAASAPKLDVSRSAGLVVVALGEFDDERQSGLRAWTNWKRDHEAKLVGKAPLRVLEVPGPLIFQGALQP